MVPRGFLPETSVEGDVRVFVEDIKCTSTRSLEDWRNFRRNMMNYRREARALSSKRLRQLLNNHKKIDDRMRLLRCRVRCL
jgi:hypothetical protein